MSPTSPRVSPTRTAGDATPRRRGVAFVPPTMDMLCVAPWTTKTDSVEIQRWRHTVNPLFRPHAKRDGLYAERPYPDFWNQQVLTDALVRRNLLYQESEREAVLRHRRLTAQGGLPTDVAARTKLRCGTRDREDLARWMGVALAFDHNDPLARMEPKATKRGREDLFEFLNTLLEECAAVAWHGRELPEWADDLLGVVREGVHPDEIKHYRPWKAIQKDLTTVLATFARYTRRSHPSIETTDEAILGGLALQLLGALEPERVSDELVTLVTWLDKNIQGDRFAEGNTKNIRSLIHVARERSLLERVSSTPDAVTLVKRSPSTRRRTL